MKFPRFDFADRIDTWECGMSAALGALVELPPDVFVVIHSDRGCVPPVRYRPRPGPPVYTSDLGDFDIVAGGREALFRAVEEMLASEGRPAAVVLLGTCLSEMTGEDLPTYARELERVHRLPFIAIPTTGLDPNLGRTGAAKQVHDSFAARFLGGSGSRRTSEVGLAGFPDDLGRTFHGEFAATLRAAGVRPGGCWPWGGVAALRRLRRGAVVFVSERIVLASFARRLEDACGVEVVEHPAPFSLAGIRSFFGEVGAIAGHDLLVSAALEPAIADATEALERFRASHAGRRVAVSCGGNRKSARLQSAIHLGIGFVPFLVEAGLDVALVVTAPETTEVRLGMEALARELGTAGRVRFHARSEEVTDVLRADRVDAVVADECQRGRCEEAGVPWLDWETFVPGLCGLRRALRRLDGVMR